MYATMRSSWQHCRSTMMSFSGVEASEHVDHDLLATGVHFDSLDRSAWSTSPTVIKALLPQPATEFYFAPYLGLNDAVIMRSRNSRFR